MKTAVWQNLDIAARKFTPFLLTLVLVIVNLIRCIYRAMRSYRRIWPLWPFTIGPLSALAPARSRRLRHWTATRLSVGRSDWLSAGTLILVFAIAVSQARFFYGKSFLVVWWGFMMVSLGMAIVEWSAASIFYSTLIAPDPAIFECAMNIAAYPILGWLFVQVHRALPPEE